MFLVAFAALAVAVEGAHAALATKAAELAFLMMVFGLIFLFVRITRKRDASGEALFYSGLRWSGETLDYSIIIPIFNRPEFLVRLHRRIEELIPGWRACGKGEIVVVDDGSTDETLAVAMRLAENSCVPMRVVTQPNKGVSGARNRGFWESRGRIGVVIDSDCLPDPDWLPEMLAAVNASPLTLAFATVYGDRKARFPLEASPAGALFAGASFAAKTDDYICLGGNFQGFSGASRDDGDLLLRSRKFGFSAVTVEHARVWHPLRQQTFGSAYRAGLAHRFDNLLLARHGDSALVFMGDWILGGQLGGHYPVSLALYSFILLVLYCCAQGLAIPMPVDFWGLASIGAILATIWLAAIVVFAALLHVPKYKWGLYIVISVGYAIGCILGRIRGFFATGMPLF